MAAMVEERVKDIVLKLVDTTESKIKLDAKLVDDLGADPVDMQQLMWELELEFEVPMPDLAPASVVTVQDTIKYVNKKLDE